MSGIYTEENRQAWLGLFASLAPLRPSVGKRVTVRWGKSHLGESGVVFWHGPDKFANTRFKTDAQLALRDAVGREGFRIGIETEGGAKFFIKADCVEVILPAHQKLLGTILPGHGANVDYDEWALCPFCQFHVTAKRNEYGTLIPLEVCDDFVGFIISYNEHPAAFFDSEGVDRGS